MKKVAFRIGMVLLCILVIAEMGLLITGNLYVNKVISMTLLRGKTGPDIGELDQFPAHEVRAATPEPWLVSSRFGKEELSDSFIQAIDEYKTVSFLVIKNDSVLYELNRENYGDSSYANSFSMAKSIFSILIGCALNDGLIHGIDDPVSQYIASFKTGEKSKITLRHLLTMSSGLGYNEGYGSPFSWPAEAYYGADVNKLSLDVEAVTEPGKQWSYKGGDTQLLGIILKEVLKGKSISDYASEKLWKRIGAEHPAFWSTDEQGMEKVSCCFYTNARDFARIGKLYMQFGRWNNEQILDSAFVAASVLPAPLADKEGKPTTNYGFQWWLMQHKGHRIFYMRGIRGQYVFVVPDLQMIVVRLGHKRAPKVGDELPRDIYMYLDAAFSIAGINP